MKVSASFVDHLDDLFCALGPVRVRPMFGGVVSAHRDQAASLSWRGAAVTRLRPLRLES